MALVTRKNNGAIASAMVPPELVDTFRVYGPLLKDWANARGNRAAGARAKSTNTLGRKGGPNKKMQKSGGGGSAGPPPAMPRFGGVPRTIPTSNTMRATLTDVSDFSNGAGGSPAFQAWGLGQGTNTNTIVGIFGLTGPISRGYTLSTLWRQFVINRFTVSFVPNVGYTTLGSIAMAIDPDPSAGQPGSYSSCIRHTVNVFGDIKSPASITYNPQIDRKVDPRYTLSSGKDDDEKSFGVVQVWSANGAPANGTIGTLMWTMDITFIGPS